MCANLSASDFSSSYTCQSLVAIFCTDSCKAFQHMNCRRKLTLMRASWVATIISIWPSPLRSAWKIAPRPSLTSATSHSANKAHVQQWFRWGMQAWIAYNNCSVCNVKVAGSDNRACSIEGLAAYRASSSWIYKHPGWWCICTSLRGQGVLPRQAVATGSHHMMLESDTPCRWNDRCWELELGRQRRHKYVQVVGVSLPSAGYCN